MISSCQGLRLGGNETLVQYAGTTIKQGFLQIEQTIA